MINQSIYSDIKFAIDNPGERYAWIGYHVLVLVSSLVGDTLILIATFRKGAFKVNTFIISVLQQVAVSDLVNAVFGTLPVLITLSANSWVLGDRLCYVTVYTFFFVYSAGMSLIAMITTSKFLILRYPLRAASWSAGRAHLVCTYVWLFALTNPVVKLAVDKDDVYFDYRNYGCNYNFSSDLWKRELLPMMVLCYFIVPNVVIVATTIPTLSYLAGARKSARRVRGSVPWQGATTVALTATVYFISTLPMIVYFIGKHFIRDQTGQFHTSFYRVSYFLMMINIMSNFYIYTLTIRSFRRFLLSMMGSTVSLSLQISTDATITGKNQLLKDMIISSMT